MNKLKETLEEVMQFFAFTAILIGFFVIMYFFGLGMGMIFNLIFNTSFK